MYAEQKNNEIPTVEQWIMKMWEFAEKMKLIYWDREKNNKNCTERLETYLDNKDNKGISQDERI